MPKPPLHLQHLPGRTLRQGQEEYLYFSGTGYLGAAHDPIIQGNLQHAIGQYGLHFGGSRLSNIRLAVFEEAEIFLAAYCGAESALLLSSGSLGGQLIRQVLYGLGDFLPSPDFHPALWQHDLPFAGTWEQWREEVRIKAQMEGPTLFLLSNSLDPLQVKRHDFSWLSTLNIQRELVLILDDSHGFGISGREGSGVLGLLDLPTSIHCLVLSSMGKAFGVPAGLVLGPEKWLRLLRQSPFFGGASPPPPAFVQAFLDSQSRYAELREKLFANLHFFKKWLPSAPQLHYMDGYPVFLCQNHELVEYFLANKIVTSSFPYPTPSSPVFTRIVLSSLHIEQDLKELQRVLELYP
jgi:7-keto-8-aminopelargonate synthetase-like enzyme